MILRQFNQAGMEAFRDFLSRCRLIPLTRIPTEFLQDESKTAVVEPAINIKPQEFITKKDAAEYLHRALAPLSEADLSTNAELWTWLTLFYFDQICPARNGRRAVKNDYTYIFEPKNSRHFYRHLLFISWRILNVAPAHNRLMLESKLNTLDKVTTEIMKRLYLTRIPAIFETLDRIYWDVDKSRPRSGITGSVMHSGNLTHRFPARLRQLERTYDLFSLTADQLIELLRDEFSQLSLSKG